MFSILHLSDIHSTSNGSMRSSIDAKTKLPNLDTSGETELIQTLESFLKKNRTLKIDLFIISGDIIKGGDTKAHSSFSEKFINLLTEYHYTKENVLVVPGNHDVKKGTYPGSEERYKSFSEAWTGCNIPYMDSYKPDTDIYQDKEKKVIVIPINTCNWSQARIELDPLLEEFLCNLPDNNENDKKIKKLFENQFIYDAAFISEEQIQCIEDKLEELKKDINYQEYTKIIVQHHHLSAVDEKIEIKALSDILNSERIKRFIIKNDIRILIHGHKHTGKSFYDYFSYENNPYKLLVISGSNTQYDSYFNYINVKSPQITIETYNKALSSIHKNEFDLYDNINSDHLSILEDVEINNLYKKICYSAPFSSTKMMMCSLDLSNMETSTLPIPNVYVDQSEQQIRYEQELNHIVDWWQKDVVNHQVPFQHGVRLRKYHGFQDQIKYIIDVLNEQKNTSRGIAILTEPLKDFQNHKTEFPSFVLLQCIVREDKYLDVIGYYRAQEMRHWWPINIHELFKIQSTVLSKLISKIQRGKLITISVSTRFSDTTAYGYSYINKLDQLWDQDPTILPALANSFICQNNHFHQYWDEIFEHLNLLQESSYNQDGHAFPKYGLEHLNKAFQMINDNGAVKNKNLEDFMELFSDIEDIVSNFSNINDEVKFNKNIGKYKAKYKKLYELYLKIKSK